MSAELSQPQRDFQDPLISAILIMQRDIWNDMASPARAVFWAVPYPSVTLLSALVSTSFSFREEEKKPPSDGPFACRTAIESHRNNK